MIRGLLRVSLSAAVAAMVIAVAGGSAARAQGAAGAVPQVPTIVAADGLAGKAGEKIVIVVGRSAVLSTPFDITRVALTNPVVADATVVSPRSVLLDGKSAGTISLIVWGDERPDPLTYELVIEPGASALQERLRQLFPGEEITVSVNDEALILSGRASTELVAQRVTEVAAATSSKAKVVNLLQLPGGPSSQQVMLQVRFAEVSRKAILELGANFFTGREGYKDWIGRSTTQQFAAPGFGQTAGTVGSLTFSDFLNLFVFNTKYNMGAVIRALQGKGYFQSLAEPNLIAYNGKEASFLAGGEIPVPVVQGGVGNVVAGITIEWKEFGVRLHFKPTIVGDMIRLHVAPEVSTLDYQNGVSLNEFRIPAIATRKAETEVELRDGQSFAIAGLLDQITQDEVDQIPGLGHIPIIGYMFKSKALRKDRTELLVMITPHLVRPLNPDEVPPLPGDPSKFMTTPPPKGPGGTMKDDGTGFAEPPDVTPKAVPPTAKKPGGGR